MRGIRRKSLPLIMAFLVSIAAINLAYAPGPVISISPEETSANPGDSFTVSVMIAAVSDLWAWEVRVTWNPDVLELDTITEGGFLQSGGLTFFAKTIDNIFGEALFGSTLIGAPGGVSGSGELASLAFTVDEAGACPFPLLDTALVDSGLFDIAHSTSDGSFSTPQAANLVKKSAWPEHHHYDISKDEDAYQTLYAIVKNVGPSDLYVKVVFNAVRDDGMIYVVETSVNVVTAGSQVTMSADLGPFTPLDTGKYAVEAYAAYSFFGDTFGGKGDKIKTFSFAAVP